MTFILYQKRNSLNFIPAGERRRYFNGIQKWDENVINGEKTRGKFQKFLNSGKCKRATFNNTTFPVSHLEHTALIRSLSYFLFFFFFFHRDSILRLRPVSFLPRHGKKIRAYFSYFIPATSLLFIAVRLRLRTPQFQPWLSVAFEESSGEREEEKKRGTRRITGTERNARKIRTSRRK